MGMLTVLGANKSMSSFVAGDGTLMRFDTEGAPDRDVSDFKFSIESRHAFKSWKLKTPPLRSEPGRTGIHMFFLIRVVFSVELT